MSEGFKYVTRGKKSRKARNKPETPTLQSLTERLESAKPAFLNSQFCGRCIHEYENVVKELSLETIVCLGLGSLVEGAWRISEIQLLLLLELRRVSNIPVIAYDPVFTDLDVEFLQSLEVTVQTMNEEDYDSSAQRTLFYLPHCDRSTNEAVISRLISTSSLEKSILLGNDLRNYSNILPDAQFKTLAPNIFNLVQDDIMEFKALEPEHGGEYWDAFSDLCLMYPKTH